MRHEHDINDLVARIMSVSLPLSVSMLGNDRVAVVEGHGVPERVIIRTPHGDHVYDVRGCGVRRVLGDVDGVLLAEIGGGAVPAAVVTLPSLIPVVELEVGEVPCVVQSRLCVVSPAGIRFPSLVPTQEPPGNLEVTGDADEIIPDLVQAAGVDGAAWVVGGPSGFHIRITSWHDGSLEVTTIALGSRPQDMAISPMGRRIALVLGGRIVSVENGRLIDVPDAEAIPGICWLDEERLCWVTRRWPDSILTTHSFDDNSRRNETLAGWTLGRLFRSGDAVAAIATRHRMPPTTMETALLPLLGPSHSEFGSVETSEGSLRTITFRSDRPPVGLVILLRGGPYGEWLPGWDPIVETIEERGWTVVQLEAPYTAAVLGRLPIFRRGQFGTRDAALVAEAARALMRRFGLRDPGTELAFVGHSYGAFLSARAVAHLDAPVAGLVTMNGPWTTADLLAMGADPVAVNSPLTRFLHQAFVPGAEPPCPKQQAQDLPKDWRVVYGTADITASAAVTAQAVDRDKPAAVLRLVGESHIPRRRESIAETVRFLDAWLRGVGLP
ncbi:alpha/beta hydrolase family protein [Rhizohabitans arisaemae]|uniref:alpha/beta hydrolase family protein n=1 Tax=Rhizohabitans arisaemae TaxID=2720610 RepID=UPI0024B1CA2F|nr:alpha/beta hydrolase [Rhizohabitans arisaemae]